MLKTRPDDCSTKYACKYVSTKSFLRSCDVTVRRDTCNMGMLGPTGGDAEPMRYGEPMPAYLPLVLFMDLVLRRADGAPSSSTSRSEVRSSFASRTTFASRIVAELASPSGATI